MARTQITKRSKKNLNKKQASSGDINMAPFVDVLFVLLITFMISAPILLGGVKVELPEGSSKTIVERQEPITVSIKADGTIYIGYDQVKLSYLPKTLSDMTEGNYDWIIYIKADKSLEYQRVIRVVDKVHSAGFSKVSLVTDVNTVE